MTTPANGSVESIDMPHGDKIGVSSYAEYTWI